MSAPSMIPEVAEQLGRCFPFDKLPAEALLALAGKTQLKYFEAGEQLFAEGEPGGERFFVVKKGLISLGRHLDAEHEVFDICDEGDLFGLRALITGQPYSATATAKEEALCYALPLAEFLALSEAHPSLSLYIAAGFAAELPQAGRRLMASTQAAGRLSAQGTLDEGDDRVVPPSREVLRCGPDENVQEAAIAMRERRVGAIIITEGERPLGILTDTDLRTKVVAEALDPAATPVRAVMSQPVMTIPEGQTVSALIGMMMCRRVHHFCVTEDGSPSSPLLGVISEHDVLSAQGSHPIVLQQRIHDCEELAELRTLRDRAEQLLARFLEREAGTGFVCEMISGINDALTQAGLRIALKKLAAEGLKKPALEFCWLSFGSQGRREQLLRTDQDNAILYADPPSDRAEATHRYFVRLGEEVCGVLIAAGFKPCPGQVMASNPALTGPLSDWRRRFSRWIRTPEPKALMNSSIYFDLRPLTPGAPLATALVEHIYEEVQAEPAFLTFLAANALHNPPPRSFFRSFILERSGEHAEAFDIKARAMMPLCDAARVLALHTGVRARLSTPGRYAAIAAAEPRLAELATEAGHAFEILLRMRAREGLRTDSSGRFLDVKSLSKLDRQTLRNTFTVVEDIQQLISTRFQTDYLRG